MKIIVFGTRGIPSIPGGVETHCEMLYPSLLEDNVGDITVICRSCYANHAAGTMFKGISLKSIYAPKNKIFEAIIHSFLSALYVIFKRPDIVHIHAIGPSLVTPILRIFGLKVVMTHHGPDYERDKWKLVPKFFLKLGERFGVRFSDKIIVISNQIARHIQGKYQRSDCYLIPNGVPIPEVTLSTTFLELWGIKPGKYILTLGRFVPEKGFDYLIEAFKRANLPDDIRLVIAGDSDHESDYSQSLKEQARSNNVILTGFIKGEPLSQLFSHSALFVLPSFYEGLPITLLEAMSYNLPILASDIEANVEVGLPDFQYFKVGDVDELAGKLGLQLGVPQPSIRYDMERYDWNKIADETHIIYKNLIDK